ncbi:MAG TPA: DUF2288 family protein [Thiohalobacter sp.]|nr:DUF2288 family protein [Thiohalobacter sp.]
MREDTDLEALRQQLLTRGHELKTMAATARDWRERDPVLWAVVTAPWVLVQKPALKP